MPLDIQADHGLGILRARYSGELDLDARLQHGRRLLEEAERTGLWRWLLDFRLAQSRTATPADAGRMAGEFNPQMPDGLRMAYLLRYDHQLDPSVEERMRDLGRQVERFHDQAEAIAWLTADAPPAVPRVAADPQGAALAQLAADLAGAGLPPPTVQQIVARMAAALRAPRT